MAGVLRTEHREDCVVSMRVQELVPDHDHDPVVVTCHSHVPPPEFHPTPPPLPVPEAGQRYSGPRSMPQEEAVQLHAVRRRVTSLGD